eukprot:3636594-Amphidinium_carterae.1
MQYQRVFLPLAALLEFIKVLVVPMGGRSKMCGMYMCPLPHGYARALTDNPKTGVRGCRKVSKV